MTLLEQCQIWNENDEYQKIIDTIEARNATSSGVAGGIKDFFKSLLGG